MKPIFETNYGGLTLSNPIIIGSSGLTDSVAKNKELEKAGVGAIILKSLFEEQISQESAQLLMSGTYPEADDYILNYFKDNEVNSYLDLIRETKKECQIPVIASINCYKDNSWIDFAGQIEKAGADAIELNILTVNTDPFEDPDSIRKTYLHICKEVCRAVKIPVTVKMSKYFSHLVSVVDQIYALGVSGVALFNRFYQTDININKLTMTSGKVFSTPADMSDTLRWTGIISGKLPQVPIAASTGVYDGEDVIKCILAGASAVQICSAVYQHGNEIIPAMNRFIEEWMAGMNFTKLDDFKGKLNYAQIDDPSLYERFQFMRYFSNRD